VQINWIEKEKCGTRFMISKTASSQMPRNNHFYSMKFKSSDPLLIKNELNFWLFCGDGRDKNGKVGSKR
jgi:hypothetical protein